MENLKPKVIGAASKDSKRQEPTNRQSNRNPVPDLPRVPRPPSKKHQNKEGGAPGESIFNLAGARQDSAKSLKGIQLQAHKGKQSEQQAYNYQQLNLDTEPYIMERGPGKEDRVRQSHQNPV